MPPVTITSGSGTTDDGCPSSGSVNPNCPSSGSVNPNGLVAVTLIGMIVLVPVAPGLLGDSGTSVDWLPLLTTTTGSARAGRPRASAATTTAIDFVCMTTLPSFSAWTPAAGGGSSPVTSLLQNSSSMALFWTTDLAAPATKLALRSAR